MSYLLIFLGSFACLLPGISKSPNVYDEGILVYGATRVMNGEVPYRDFWTLYGPGQFYILAGLFRVFGISIVAERLWDRCIRAALALGIYVISRDLTSRQTALIVWSVSVLWLGYFGYFSHPIFPATLCTSLSVLIATKSFFRGEARRSLWSTGAGMSIGTAALFRHDFGFYALLAQISAAAIFAYRGFIENQELGFGRIWLSSREQRAFVVYLSIGIVTVLILPTVFLVNAVTLDELTYDLLVFPTAIFPKFRSLAYPAPFPNPLRLLSEDLSIWDYIRLSTDRIPFYFPVIVYISMFISVIIRIRKADLGNQERSRLQAVLLIALLGIVSFNQARIRSDHIHLELTLVPALILFGVLLEEYAAGSLQKKRLLARLIFLMVLVAIAVRPFCSRIKAVYETLPGISSNHLERARYIHLDPDQASAVAYIQSHVLSGDQIYVGNSVHDRIYANDVMFYFLSERHSATKYHELHPGLATTLPVQREIAKEVRQSRVEYIVLLSRFQDAREPNESAVSSGVTFLDDFIKANYVPIEQFGTYTILRFR